MGRRVWLGLVVVAACAALVKPPEPDRRLNVHTSGDLFESGAGYRFVSLPEPNASVVRLLVRYPVGSSDDPVGKPGLAHLVEHLVFEIEIERNGARTSIGAELARLALWWNATTELDTTSYEALFAPGALDEVLALEVDRLAVGCRGLTPAIFEREREVVLDELRQRQGASGAAIEQSLNDQVFPAGHPYRAVDSVESVSALTLQDACDFLAGPYLRGKPVVIASGAVDLASLQKAASAPFARAPKRSGEPRDELAAAPVVHATVRIKQDLEEPTLVVTWPMPTAQTSDYRLLELVWNAIPYRLDAFGATYKWGHGATAWIAGGPRAPVLVVAVALTGTDKLDEATAAVGKSVEFAKRILGTEADTRAWQLTWQAGAQRLLSRWESLGGRDRLVAELLDEQAGDSLLVGRIDELTKMTPVETRGAVDRWLDPKRARFILLEPSGVATAAGVKTYRGGAEDHGVRVDPSLADRPLAIPSTRLTLDVDHYQLDNGLTLVLWPGSSSPLVHGRLVVQAGTAQDPPGAEGVSAFVGASELDEDTLVFDETQLATRVDDLVHSLTLELRDPGYELTDDDKALLRAALARKSTREATAYARELLAAVYGDGHPYARLGLSEEGLAHLGHDRVFAWAREHVVPRGSVLVVAGQFDVGLVEKHVRYDAAQVSSGHEPEPVATPPRPGDVGEAPRFVRGLRDKPSPTLHIDVAFAAGRGLDAAYAKRMVLEAVLDSKLHTLRGKHALTYGFYATYVPRTAGGMWQISGEADATRAAEAGAAIAQVFADLRRDPESYRLAFVLARQKVIESLLGGATDSGAIADRLAWMARFHLADDFYDHLARDVAKLTLADMAPFVTAELAQTRQVFGAFGNAAAVDAALDAAKGQTR